MRVFVLDKKSISYRHCTLIQRGDGYGYAAIPPATRVGGFLAEVL